jgi:hypothetical protein
MGKVLNELLAPLVSESCTQRSLNAAPWLTADWTIKPQHGHLPIHILPHSQWQSTHLSDSQAPSLLSQKKNELVLLVMENKA